MIRTSTPPRLPRVGQGQVGRRPVSPNRSGKNEPVEMQEKRFGYFPQRFNWRGRAVTVQAVERCWTRTGRSARLCFRVRCEEGVFDLVQSVKTDIWTLSIVQ